MRRPLPCLLAVVVLALLVAGAGSSAPASDPPTSTGTGGAAATVDRLASEAALQILRAGGNAVDGAVAAAAVLGVTEPFSCGVGGGGFMVVYQAPTKPKGHPHVFTIDNRETAPAAMKPDSFWEGGKPLAFNDARFSGISVGVPGAVRGWATAMSKWGSHKVTFAQVLAPAIAVAQNGFVVDQTFFDQTRDNVDYFNDIPATAALYLDADGTPRDVGSTFRNPDLAKTYQLLATGGPDALYTGEIANAIVQTVTHPVVASNANHVFRPGLMAASDLQSYVAKPRAPTRVRYRGLDVFSMGPPSSGGSTVGEALNILEAYNLAGMPREQAYHLFLEASRFAFADRGAYLGDPDFVKVPLAGLMSKQYAAQRRALIGDRAASSPVPAGTPPGALAARGTATETQPGTTTHITVADKQGNAVAYTYTIESTGGSALLVPGYGFILNNELTDFNFDSLTHPNSVAGGKRPRSSISPTIVLNKGKPFFATGSPGGSTIITTVLQILVDRIDLGLTLPQAIADPRASQRNTATLSVEAEWVARPENAALLARGHRNGSPAEIGAATGIEFLSGGRFLAAAEPVRRGAGSALVVTPG